MDLIAKLAKGGDTGFLGQIFKKNSFLPSENQNLDPGAMPVPSPGRTPAKESEQDDDYREDSEMADP
jgi:hypothetical protein